MDDFLTQIGYMIMQILEKIKELFKKYVTEAVETTTGE